MPEEFSNQQRFCTNCGNQIRPGVQFCVNCGANLSLNQEPTESSSIPSTPSASEQFDSVMNSLREAFSRLKARFSTPSSSTPNNTWRGTPNRFLSWFRDISTSAKFVFVGLVSILVLLVLALLSPVIRGLAILAFIVSMAFLIIRAIQRKSIRGWGIIAAASLVLIPMFGGVSGVVYDSSTRSGNEVAGNSENYMSGGNSDPGEVPSHSDSAFDDAGEPFRNEGGVYIVDSGILGDDMSYYTGGDAVWDPTMPLDFAIAGDPYPEELALCLGMSTGHVENARTTPTCAEMYTYYDEGFYPPSVKFDSDTGELRIE